MREGTETVQQLPEEQSEVEENLEETKDEPTEETARDTVERVLEELSEETEEKVQSDGGQEDVESSEVRNNEHGSNEVRHNEGYSINIPQRFTVEEKEAFNKLSPDLKRAVSNMVHNHERAFHEKNNQITAKEREVSHILESVRPYLSSNPQLLQEGYTEGKLVAALIGTHQRLTDPKTGPQELVDIGKSMGLDMSSIEDSINGYGQEAEPSYVNDLRNELNSVKSFVSDQQNARQQQVLHIVKSQILEAQESRDASGNYLYPELHDQNFLQKVEPLVRTLIHSTPGLSIKDAYIRARNATVGQAPRELSQNTTSSGLHTNNAENVKKARAAVASVRGRSAPPLAPKSEDIPPEALESPQASVKWAIKHLSGG